MNVNERQLPAGHEPKLLENPDGHPPAAPVARRHKRARWIVAGLLILFAILFAAGYWRHRRIETAAADQAKKQQQTLPVVTVAKVRRSPAYSELLLPGNMTPLTETYIYARASGYVRRRYVDIGDRVHEGQVLAEIESPDLDEQVRQARAGLDQARQQLQQTRANLQSSEAQLELARVTWERYRVLADHGAIARQEADQQLATYRTAQAAVSSGQANVAAAQHNVSANEANVGRMLALQAFEKLRAPFSGVITARNFDIGALVNGSGSSLGASTTPLGGTQISGAQGNAGVSGVAAAPAAATGAAGGELFRMAQIDVLRTLVNVPQENAPTVRSGQSAKLFIQEFSNRPFEGQVTRTANAIDPATRTLLTEVQVRNPRLLLLPGMYCQVQLVNSRSNPPLLVPGDSIMPEANGILIAILQDLDKEQQGRYPQNARRIHLQTIQVGRDYGPAIEVTNGLQGWEYVVVNPSDAVEEGAVVMPAAAPRLAGEGGAQRRGPSEQRPGRISAGQPGAADTGGRGASTKARGTGKK